MVFLESCITSSFSGHKSGQCDLSINAHDAIGAKTLYPSLIFFINKEAVFSADFFTSSTFPCSNCGILQHSV